MEIRQPYRHLNIIFGDQLNRSSLLFEGVDTQQDIFWMAEVSAASLQPPSHQQRSLLFLSAMRHFAQALHEENLPLQYFDLDAGFAKFADALTAFIALHTPEKIRCVLPGDYGVLQSLKQFCTARAIPLEILPDNHFIAIPGEFTSWAKGKTNLRMEYWYRHLRKRTGILMEANKPLGGNWNYDKDNRRHFGDAGPGMLEPPLLFEMDQITLAAQQSVKKYFPTNPGTSDFFAWPVTREQALQLLNYFVEHQLPLFGEYQDAMWTHEPWLYHSRLSAAMNLKLISPLEVIKRAEAAYHQAKAPLNAVEGFIRQILGWREYVCGIYWSLMPDWLNMNALEAQQLLPDFYWTGEVDMRCLQQALQQVLQQGYGHHIQRLMITGLFAQLWQTRPLDIHNWYLGMYVDAVEWVELPNVLGMSQYADGGLMASKPYIASGRYINSMSNYCDTCIYKPNESDTENACPFTTLYWNFLEQHKERFRKHPRLGLQVQHLENMEPEKRAAITRRVADLRARYTAGTYKY